MGLGQKSLLKILFSKLVQSFVIIFLLHDKPEREKRLKYKLKDCNQITWHTAF